MLSNRQPIYTNVVLQVPSKNPACSDCQDSTSALPDNKKKAPSGKVCRGYGLIEIKFPFYV